MPNNICKYYKECLVYQGEVSTNGIPLTIYKNVFCNRGYKGWRNYEKYIDYKKQDLVKKE